ncbi:hypothetical protein ACNSO7_13705 [Yersinia enterocolitica]|uniref:hypothetical protein n=1 Tax=Yersinia enterocolitica TaxID=630 RepID=UPI003AB2BE94
MRPSDLLLDFGRPVAYYPGLVKYMGSPHAVIFFGQIFYWQDKAHSELGVQKTQEEIQEETGLTVEQQKTARKQLVSRGILIETNKRLEHKMYYRVDCDRLNEIVDNKLSDSRNGVSLIRETVKPLPAKSENPSPRARETLVRGEVNPRFDLTEITTKNTTEITTENKICCGPTQSPATGKITSKSKPEETSLKEACRKTWEAYKNGYWERYGVDPVRNAKVSSQIKQFVERVGMEAAPHVARFYLLVNNTFYVQKLHPVGCLLADAESLHTQWATGRTMTAARAKQIDSTQTNLNAADETIRMLRARRAANGGQHAE